MMRGAMDKSDEMVAYLAAVYNNSQKELRYRREILDLAEKDYREKRYARRVYLGFCWLGLYGAAVSVALPFFVLERWLAVVGVMVAAVVLHVVIHCVASSGCDEVERWD